MLHSQYKILIKCHFTFLAKLLEDVAIQRGEKLLNKSILLDLPLVHKRHVLCHMKEEMYTPNDTIIKAGSKGSCMYFIASGTVVVKSPAGKEVIA